MKAPVALQHHRTQVFSKSQWVYARVADLEQDNIRPGETIRRNCRLFAGLLSNGRQGIALTGPDRQIVRLVNELSGFDPASLSGQVIDSSAVPEDREIIVAAYRRIPGPLPLNNRIQGLASAGR